MNTNFSLRKYCVKAHPDGGSAIYRDCGQESKIMTKIKASEVAESEMRCEEMNIQAMIAHALQQIVKSL
jgi:hypothetical protein